MPRIAVEAMGEVADLKNNINQMIVTLRDTTKANAEQGWLDSNLARIGGLLQGQRDLGEVCRMIMTEVTPLEKYYEGEAYHQDYAARNPRQSYIAYAAAPKVEKLRTYFGDRLKQA